MGIKNTRMPDGQIRVFVVFIRGRYGSTAKKATLLQKKRLLEAHGRTEGIPNEVVREKRKG